MEIIVNESGKLMRFYFFPKFRENSHIYIEKCSEDQSCMVTVWACRIFWIKTSYYVRIVKKYPL
jgi:hypothetical protein